jgi:hypothetical protein
MSLRIFFGLLVCCTVSGCVVENDPSPSRGGSTIAPTPVSGSGSTGSAGGSSSTGSGSSSTVAPMLVDVDTNQTMSAAPGDGVGVFVEYKAGGGWHLWWTCDTNKSSQTCNFTIKLAATNALSNVVTAGAAQASDVNPGVTTFQTVTGSTIDGVTFNTTAGDVLTLDASVDGLQDGSFVFFVQGGKVNGGYTGKLTNPLKLEGSTP